MMIYPNVEKYLAEQKKNTLDLAQEIGAPKSTLYGKFAGQSEISLKMAADIKRAIGADEPLETLFATTPAV